MKKRLIALAFIVACIFVSLSLVGCDEVQKPVEYSVKKSEFYFSTDNGNTYGNRRMVFEVGDTVFMQLQIEVSSTSDEKETVTCDLMIPYIDAVDAYYYRGQKITPTRDAISNLTTYSFTVTTNELLTVFFKFVPNTATTVQMELGFDDKVDSKYDMISAIDFVNVAEE